MKVREVIKLIERMVDIWQELGAAIVSSSIQPSLVSSQLQVNPQTI